MSGHLDNFSQHPEFLYLALMMAIALVAKWWPSKPTNLNSFAPALDRADQTLNAEAEVPDTLSIPLTRMTESLRFWARFNTLYKLVVIVLPLLSFGLGGFASGARNDTLESAGIWCLVAWPPLALVALLNWWWAKYKLRLIPEGRTPALCMDINGMTVPLLLVETRAVVRDRLEAGAKDITLKWSDIGLWTVYSDRSDMTLRTRMHCIFEYRLSVNPGALANNVTGLALRRPFSAEDERKILTFAAKRLARPLIFNDSFV